MNNEPDRVSADEAGGGSDLDGLAAGAAAEGAAAAATQSLIDLTDKALGSRTVTPSPIVSGRPADLLEHHRLEVVTGGDAWIAAEAFVYERYRRVGYTQPSPHQRVEELARWADQSRFHVVFSNDDRIVGTMRTIPGYFADLPVGQFERTDFTDPDPVCELSSMVVDESVRSSGVLEHLFRAGWSDATRLGASAIVALIDVWLLEMMRFHFCMPFVPIGIPHHHMGGDVVPVAMDITRPGMMEVGRNNPGWLLWNLEKLSDEEIRRYDLGGLVPQEIADQFAAS
jgi:N-acyl-L-homoserine lactone synthetase